MERVWSYYTNRFPLSRSGVLAPAHTELAAHARGTPLERGSIARIAPGLAADGSAQPRRVGTDEGAVPQRKMEWTGGPVPVWNLHPSVTASCSAPGWGTGGLLRRQTLAPTAGARSDGASAREHRFLDTRNVMSSSRNDLQRLILEDQTLASG
ncbi:hypothetical protein AAFF_G00166890 [Aldrovandia affinis]|uniref:Uncharacterized protein n=1 Tax=Aldrovandia affinis TaxID=143900 RepID=A0AAD7RMF2_9TELE|nr:hypothetical protein AAFF_G00166890 [Aldrovandia affinis]